MNETDKTISASDTSNGWMTIETAPKDGTLIRIGWKLPQDAKMQEWFVMRWGHIQTNGLFPNTIGMWVTPDGSLTWNDSDKEAAPTHWMPLPKPPVQS